MVSAETVDVERVDSASVRFATRLRQLRTDQGITLKDLGRLTTRSWSLIHKIERGERFPDWPTARRCDEVLDARGELVRLWPQVDVERQAADQRRTTRVRPNRPRRPAPSGEEPVTDDDRGLSAEVRRGLAGDTVSPDEMICMTDEVRHAVNDLLDDGTPGSSRLERLEAQVGRHARDALTVAPLEMLGRLDLAMVDADQLGRRGADGRFDSGRLRAAIARLSVMIADAMVVLGCVPAARAWYETAEVAAAASTSETLQADVCALASTLPLYQGHSAEAIRAARHAADIAGRRVCLATMLAPVTESLALARSGRTDRAREAFGEARDGFARTDATHREESVFGLSPRKMLFFEGRLLTEIGEYGSAWTAHEQALGLYPEDVVGDRALIYLDRAAGLLHTGRPMDGAELVTTAVLGLPESHRGPLFLHEALKVLESVPLRVQRLPAVQACRSVILDLEHRRVLMRSTSM